MSTALTTKMENVLNAAKPISWTLPTSANWYSPAASTLTAFVLPAAPPSNLAAASASSTAASNTALRDVSVVTPDWSSLETSADYLTAVWSPTSNASNAKEDMSLTFKENALWPILTVKSATV